MNKMVNSLLQLHTSVQIVVSSRSKHVMPYAQQVVLIITILTNKNYPYTIKLSVNSMNYFTSVYVPIKYKGKF